MRLRRFFVAADSNTKTTFAITKNTKKNFNKINVFPDRFFASKNSELICFLCFE
jgi:hypothetical protein